MTFEVVEIRKAFVEAEDYEELKRIINDCEYDCSMTTEETKVYLNGEEIDIDD